MGALFAAVGLAGASWAWLGTIESAVDNIIVAAKTAHMRACFIRVSHPIARILPHKKPVASKLNAAPFDPRTYSKQPKEANLGPAL